MNPPRRRRRRDDIGGEEGAISRPVRVRYPKPMKLRTPSALSLSLALALAACGGKADPAKAGRPIAVRTAVAIEKSAPVEVRAVGRIVSSGSVALRPQVSGLLLAARFSEGQRVAAGQVLLEIDPRPYAAALAEARARRDQERARAENAKAETARLTELAARDLIGKQEFETAKANAAAAAAGAEAAEAAVQRAELNLSWCTIRAPISGRTGRILVHPGNLVAAGAAEPLVTIEQTRPVFASFSIPERHLSLLRQRGKAQAVQVRTSGGGGATGTVDFIDNAVDTATGTILLKARIPNEDEALLPGQIVDVTVALAERAKALVVPASAVSQGQQGDFVFVVKGDRSVELRTVAVDQVLGDEAVIGRGVAAGETVVTEGQLKLVPGAKVEPAERAPEGK
jgi:multidrug efflux system membrane fusion protein